MARIRSTCTDGGPWIRTLWPRSLVGRLVLIAGLGLLALYFAPAKVHPRHEVTLRAESVPLNATDPRQVQVSRLRFVAGVSLTAPDEDFGGISGLRIFRDGHGWQLTGVTDSGESLSGPIDLRDGRIGSVGPLTMASLPDLSGRLVSGKRWGDAESLTSLGEGGWLVGFERKHRIWSYARDFSGPAGVVETPAALLDAPSNSGLESLASWPDGQLLALTEGMETARGTLAGFLRAGGRWSTVEWTASGSGFQPSDATTLPGGDLLVLERRWSALAPTTFKARILRVRRGAIWPGAILQGELLGELSAPLTVDNFEGITAFTDPSRPGATQVFIVSDDNFNPTQKNLLLWFELADDAIAAPRSTR